MSRPSPLRRHTVQDYLSWPDDARCELIHGEVHDMAPAPSLDHQEAVGALYAALREAAGTQARTGGGPPPGGCEVFVAPVDVILAEDTVVQPDVVVVSDPSKTSDRRRVRGAPDLVVEVLSPATALKDRREKRALYEWAGVPEYLLVDPAEQCAELYRLDADRRYGSSRVLGADDTLALDCLPALAVTLAELLGWRVMGVREPGVAAG